MKPHKILFIGGVLLLATACKRDDTTNSSDIIESLQVKDIYADGATLQARLGKPDEATEMGFAVFAKNDTIPMSVTFPAEDIVDGIFYCHLSGLDPLSKYSFKPYVVINNQRYEGRPLSFYTNNSPIRFATIDPESLKVTDVTARSFVISGALSSLGGGGQSIVEYGAVCWPVADPVNKQTLTVTPDPTAPVKINTTMPVTLFGLMPETDYQAQIYFRNSIRGTQWSDTVAVHTGAIAAPAVEILGIDGVGTTYVTVNGHVASTGNDPMTTFGVYFGASTPPQQKLEITDKQVQPDGSWLFSAKVRGLQSSTKYYFQTFAANYLKEVRSDFIKETTTKAPSAPEMLTVQIVDHVGLGTTSATLNGELLSDGDSPMTGFGFKFGPSGGSLTNMPVTSIDPETGAFSLTVTGLTSNTAYDFQAYGSNEQFGEGVGDKLTFKTAIDGGMLKACKRQGVSATVGSIVSTNVPLIYFELDPIDIQVEALSKVTDANPPSVSTEKIFFLDRNLGARKVAPKAQWVDGATFNEDSSPMTQTEWIGWYGGYYYKWNRKDPSLPMWIYPVGESDFRVFNVSNSGSNKEFYAVASTITEISGWTNDTYPTISDWDAANNPCPPGYRIPTSSEWQAVSRAVGGDMNRMNNVLKIALFGGHAANGQNYFDFISTSTATSVESWMFAGYLWSSTALTSSSSSGVNRTITNIGNVIPGNKAPNNGNSWTYNFANGGNYNKGLTYCVSDATYTWPNVSAKYRTDVNYTNDPSLTQTTYQNYYYYDQWQFYGLMQMDPGLGIPVRCARTE